MAHPRIVNRLPDNGTLAYDVGSTQNSLGFNLGGLMNKSAFSQITPHVYWLSPDATTDRPVLGVIAGGERTLIVDAGNSPAHAKLLLYELSEAGLAPPAFVALTHWHWDHVFGTSAFELPTFAHAITKRIVAEMAGLDWSDAALDRRVEAGVEIAFCRDMIKAELVDRSDLRIRPPDITFDSQVEIDLGQVTCQIVHVGGDHGADSSIVYVPEEKAMFLGDCLSPDLYTGESSYTTQKLFPLIDQLLAYEVDYYLAGHDPQPLSTADMIKESHLLKSVGRIVGQPGQTRAAILARLQAELGGPLDDDHIELVDEFLAGLSKSASQPEWVGF